MKRELPLVTVACLVLAAGTSLAKVIDGSEGGQYPPALVIQNNQTNFGDSNLGNVDWANGSELDVAYAEIVGGSLFLMLAGNLESNYNKLEIFIDSGAGGQNKLRGDNPDVDFNGLNRMGDDGSGNGLTFDAGFEADYYITMTGGDGGGFYQCFANHAEVPTGGGGIGTFVGGGAGTAHSGALGINFAINNSNTAGVSSGAGAGSGAGVTTGMELEIPLSAIGNPAGCVRVCAFINGGGHDFLANQVLGGLGGVDNLGEPRNVNFNNQSGTQHFDVCPSPVSLDQSSWGRIKAEYR